MRKTTLYFWLDLVIGLAFVIETVSGLALFLFPRSWLPATWGVVRWMYAVGRFTWISWHDWAALALVVGVIVHVVLHWRWIKSNASRLWRESRHVDRHR